MFSVVIPLYNKELTIRRTLLSALNQSYKKMEIIVVNDGSTDSGPMIVESMIKDNRQIRQLHQENKGVSAARNLGIQASEKQYIAFLDGDDEWLPEHLQDTKSLIHHYPECGFYAARYFLRALDGKQRAAIINGLPKDFEGIIENYFDIASRSDPPVWSSAVCARKDALLDIGGFPEGVPLGEDLLTWARLAARYPLAYSMKCNSIYYLSSSETYDTPPGRIPPEDDIVGKGLKALLENMADPRHKSLRKYCSIWHKMRASFYLRLGMNHEARREIKLAFKYHYFHRLLIYWLLTFLPLTLVQHTFRRLAIRS